MKLVVSYDNSQVNKETMLEMELEPMLGDPDAMITGTEETQLVFKFSDEPTATKFQDYVNSLKKKHSIINKVEIVKN